MKKFLSLLLVFVMLLGVLCACNDTDKNVNTSSDDANVPSTKPQAKIAMEMYEAAIKDEICVFDKDLGEIKLKECRFPTDNTTLGECEILYKAILDLDGDGINEYVIQSEAKDHIVLRYYDGLVYSYCFGSMDLYNLNINGSFYWIDSYELTNCTRGYNKIAFDGSSLSIKEIYKIKQTRAEDYGDGTHEYYVGGKQITREEFLDYYSYSEKTLAIFSPLDISCEYPISSEKAFELASNYWGFKSGMEEGAAGTYYILKIVILEKPNGDTQSYRIGKQAEGYTTHAIDSSSAQPPQSVSIYEELFVDAITGECFEESKPNEEDESSESATPSYSTEELLEVLNLSDALANTLKNEVPVYITSSSAFVSAADLDGDGTNDILLIESGDKSIVFGGRHPLESRHNAYYNLRTDGTYDWNEQAGNVYGSSKLRFWNGDLISVELDRVEYNEKFYINELKASAEEFKEYCETKQLAEKAARYLWKFENSDDAPSTISYEEAEEIATEYFYECYKVKPGDADSETGYKFAILPKSSNNANYIFALAWLVEGTHFSTLELIEVNAFTGEIIPYDYNNNSSVG